VKNIFCKIVKKIRKEPIQGRGEKAIGKEEEKEENRCVQTD